jgi:hypothetical protein
MKFYLVTRLIIKIFSFIKKNSFHFSLFFATTVNFLINFRFFLESYYFSGDTGLYTKSSIPLYYNPYLWLDFNLLEQSKISETPRLIINSFIYLLSSMGLNFNDAILQIVVFTPFVILGTFSSFILSYYFSKSPIISIIFSLFYMNSSIIISSISMGHLLLIIPISLTPLFFYLLIKLKESNNNIYLYFLILTSFLSSIYDLRFSVLDILFAIFYILINLWVDYKENISLLKKFFIFIIIFIGMNSFWIFPEIYVYLSRQSIENSLLARESFSGIGSNIIYTILNQHPNIDFTNFEVFNKKSYQIFFYLLPIYLLFSLYFFSKNKPLLRKILPFYFLILISFFISKQNDFPFRNFYFFLDQYLSLFTSIYREGTRFYHFVTLFYLIIFSYFLGNFNKNFKTKYLILFSIFIMSIYYLPTIFLNYNGTLYQTKDFFYKDLDIELSSFFNNPDNQGNILIFSKIKEVDFYGSVNNQIIDNNLFEKKYQLNILNLCESKDFVKVNKLLNRFNIRYILLNEDDINIKNLESCNLLNNKLTLGDTSENFLNIYLLNVTYTPSVIKINSSKYLISNQSQNYDEYLYTNINYDKNWKVVDFNNFLFYELNYLIEEDPFGFIKLKNQSYLESKYLYYIPHFCFIIGLSITCLIFVVILALIIRKIRNLNNRLS